MGGNPGDTPDNHAMFFASYVRARKIIAQDNMSFSIGFYLTPEQINSLKAINTSNSNELDVFVIINNLNRNDSNEDNPTPIWITASNLVEHWCSTSHYVEFVSISFCFTTNRFLFESDFWLLDMEH